MTITKRKAHPDDKARVRRAILWGARYGEIAGGLYYDGELAGPDGLSIEILVEKSTPEEQIEAAAKLIYEKDDVVRMCALVCPSDWFVLCYASEEDLQLAEDLGYTANLNAQRGHVFGNGKRSVWACPGKGTDAELSQWQSADRIDGAFQNRQMFTTLAAALRRPL